MTNNQYENVWDTQSYITSLHAVDCELHFHSAIEILIGIKGSLCATINQSDVHIGPGDMLISNPYDIHTYKLDEPDTITHVIIIPYVFINPFFTHNSNKKIPLTVVNDAETYKNSLDLIKMLDIARVSGHHNLTKLLALSLFEMIIKDLKLEEIKKDNVNLCKDILKYLYENFEEEINLNVLAKKYAYSPNYFSKLFHTYLRMSLSDFVNKLRLEKAIERIKKGEEIISAAYNSGFNSLRTFYRCFKNQYQMTPKEYFKTK